MQFALFYLDAEIEEVLRAMSDFLKIAYLGGNKNFNVKSIIIWLEWIE